MPEITHLLFVLTYKVIQTTSLKLYLQVLLLVMVAKVSSEGLLEGAIPTRVVSMGIVSLTDTTEQYAELAGTPGVSSMG